MLRVVQTSLIVFALLAGALTHAPAASARIVWRAGAERGLMREWANYSCQRGRRISRVSPGAHGRYAYRVRLFDGDDSYGERCEMAMGAPMRRGFPVFRKNTKSWIAYQVLIPPRWPGSGWRYNEISQFKSVNDLCGPPLSLHVEQGRLLLFKSADNRSSCTGWPIWSARMRFGRWIKLLYHVKWSSNPRRGWVELYGSLDGGRVKRLLKRRRTFTMKKDGRGRTRPVSARLGIYRDRSIRGDATAYFDGFTIATDRAGAVRGAFGP
jgi:polysaccharide lyase-like protein